MPLDILKSYHKTELTTSVTFSVDGVTNSIKLHLEEEFEEETVTAGIQTGLEKITLVKTSQKGSPPVYSIREESDSSAVSDERQNKMKLASWIAVVAGQIESCECESTDEEINEKRKYLLPLINNMFLLNHYFGDMHDNQFEGPSATNKFIMAGNDGFSSNNNLALLDNVALINPTIETYTNEKAEADKVFVMSEELEVEEKASVENLVSKLEDKDIHRIADDVESYTDSLTSLCSFFARKCVFYNLPVSDLSDPKRHLGTDDVRANQLYIPCKGGQLGAWYMFPADSTEHVQYTVERDSVELNVEHADNDVDLQLASAETVILYLHGCGCDRSEHYRVGLYKALVGMGHHVMAVDYRGYGDSTNTWPSEETMVSDARAALAWLTDKVGDQTKVVVWGHSLGSAVATHMLADVAMELGKEKAGALVSGLVLETPFSSMRDEVGHFKLATAFVWCGVNMDQALEVAGAEFETRKWVAGVACQVLILATERDTLVPHTLAASLHHGARDQGRHNTRLVTFPASLQLGHTEIYTSARLTGVLQQFIMDIAVDKHWRTKH